MSRSPFSRDFSDLPEEDMIRGLEVHFCKRQKGKYYAADLPPLCNLNWKAWDQRIINAYAEALLWARALGDPVNCPQELADFSPFGKETPPLKELWSHPCAISQFPTIRRNGQATVWRLYLFRKPTGIHWNDHRNRLTSADGFPRDAGVFLMNRFLPPQAKIDGDSWQLAYQMAARLLEDPGSEYQEKLLQHLMTGAVRNEQIAAVEMRGKTDSAGNFESFLIPEANKDDVPDPENRKFHFVSSTDAAWRLVTGVGFKQKQIALPPEIDQLHILVGGSPQPVLSVILLLNPKKVFFWISRETEQVSRQIQEALSTHSGELPMIFESRLMDSHDLQAAYDNLDATIKRKNGGVQIISCTGGNRLMGFAALLVAQARRVQVVYRDLNARRNTLIGIQFERNQRYSSDLTVNRCPIKGKINWDWLYDNEKPDGDLASHLFLNENPGASLKNKV